VFTGFWSGGPKVRDDWQDLGAGRRITLSWIFRKILIDEANCIQVARDRV
jgi:hypothetical protein